MTGFLTLTKRNIKLFFKDKGMFLTSLITPLILLVLYATFLSSIYKDSFASAMSQDFPIDESIIDAMVAGELISSLLAVSCVTVAFCSNFVMVQDKLYGARNDISMTPVKPAAVPLAYFCASAATTLIISFAALAIGLIYTAVVGWYMSVADVVGLIADVFLLTLFGVAISSCVTAPLKTSGQASAVGTIVSAGYGFICGAYMPISNFAVGLQRILSFLPGTYGTALVRNHCMNGAFRGMAKAGLSDDVVNSIRDAVDCNLYFFDSNVEIPVMYAILGIAVAVFIGIYVFESILLRRRRI